MKDLQKLGGIVRQNKLIVYFFYLVLIWIAYYFKFNQFGLYEDDYWIVGIPADSSFSDLWGFIKSNIINLQRNQGRYVATFLPFIVAHVNFQIGGVSALYAFGLLLVSLNAFIIFKIVHKSFSFEVALLCGLVFAIYPGDTTKAFLVHIYHLQISLFFTLLGMLLYVNNKKAIGYLLAFTSMMNYENAFLPFVFATFFTNLKWDKDLFMKWIKHVAIIGSFFVLLFVIRKLVGENTISNLETVVLIKRTLISFITGPLTAGLSFLNACYQTVISIKDTFYIILAALLLIGLLNLVYPQLFKSSDKSSAEAYRSKSGFAINDEQFIYLKLFILGVVMTVVGYSFAFPHYPPTTLYGRITSVHFGGAFGISLTVSAFFRLLLTLKLGKLLKRMVIGLFVLLLALCTGYGMLIQNDYVRSWNIQKEFWSDVLKECPDITENTLVLVQKTDVPQTKYTMAYSWAYPLIYDLIYVFPENWKTLPKLDILDSTFTSVIEKENGNLIYKPKLPFLFDNQNKIIVDTNNLILLELEGDNLTRLSDTLILKNNVKIPLNREIKNVEYPKEELYNFIIEEQN